MGERAEPRRQRVSRPAADIQNPEQAAPVPEKTFQFQIRQSHLAGSIIEGICYSNAPLVVRYAHLNDNGARKLIAAAIKLN